MLVKIIICLCLTQTGYGIMQLCGYVDSHSSLYKVTGSFDNPAGFAGCLCASIPFILVYSKHPNRIIQWGSYILFFLVFIVVSFSQSRAGIASLLVVISFFFIHRHTKRLVNKLLLFSIVLSILLSCSFLVKKNSANGRLFIWQCTWEMIKDKPFSGHGIGAFNAHYMDYQAAYFEHNPDSQYQMLADNIKHPFNEYLKIGVQYGIISWGVLIFIAFFLIYCYKRSSSFKGYICLLSLLSIATFAFFSYPFTYPFIWIITILNIAIIIRQRYKDIQFKNGKIVKRIMGIGMFVICLFLLYTMATRIKAEIKWTENSRLSASSKINNALPAYKELLPVLGKEPYFLYNYAAELYMKEKYEECLIIAKKCRHYWADYDLELIQAEANINLEQYEKAKVHLNRAKFMCPARFVPLYRLYHIYQIQNNKKMSTQLALDILRKPVKVNSLTIQLIKAEMKSKLLNDGI